ncbi:alkylmercury lyase family protein [Crossiella sp. CA-258035]|uniref:alkylmercury lyase family protein n=1 Tax=Crossiella sp. CA-258035 TaxID=2981138 RepID=UPI0024BD0BE6|nr:alkylmercury lyase family protein [Crossiella sp. CA-258035]WHT23369.1 alkylmercury lyase family protein [Crossiella sp. CA-258035]
MLSGREDVTVTIEVVDTAEQAAQTGMNGSPTLLVDGADPFAEPGQTPNVSCRIYRDEQGSPTGTPTPSQLRAALGPLSTPPPRSAHGPAMPGSSDCCDLAGNVISSAEDLRVWRARTAPDDPAAYAVHQAILRAFAATGRPPSREQLQPVAASEGATADSVLTRLHDADVIRLDPAGAIRIAYPFSSVPTRHHVRLATGLTVSAMCAIDALGMPAMLGTDATITSIDPVTGDRVVITVHNGRYNWEPATAVVFSSAATGTGPSADCCCDDINAFTTPATAHLWMSKHPSTPGELLDTTTAEHLGRQIFGALLDQHAPSSHPSLGPT